MFRKFPVTLHCGTTDIMANGEDRALVFSDSCFTLALPVMVKLRNCPSLSDSRLSGDGRSCTSGPPEQICTVLNSPFAAHQKAYKAVPHYTEGNLINCNQAAPLSTLQNVYIDELEKMRASPIMPLETISYSFPLRMISSLRR